MSSHAFNTRAIWLVPSAFSACLLATLASAASGQDPFVGTPAPSPAPAKVARLDFRGWPIGNGQPAPSPAPAKVAKLPVKPGAVEVVFTDGSHLKMLLRDEKIALITPHGELLIAVKDIHRIEFAWRLADEDARRIDAAVADLGSPEFRKREAASAELRMLGIKAYTALLGASQHKDAEVARRAKELASQIHDATPAELRVFPKDDIVYTADSMIAGRIEGTSMKAQTAQFGALQVKLSDARSLRSQAIAVTPTPPANTATGDVRQFQQQRH